MSTRHSDLTIIERGGVQYGPAVDDLVRGGILEASLAAGLLPAGTTASAVAPGAPAVGQVWIDQSVFPAVARQWSGAAWVVASATTLFPGSGGGGGAANLSYTAATGVVANSNGTGFTIPMATAAVRGLWYPGLITALGAPP